MKDTVKVRYYVRTDMVGSTCEDIAEFDRAEWEAMGYDEKEEAMKELAFNSLEWGYSEVQEGSGDE